MVYISKSLSVIFTVSFLIACTAQTDSKQTVSQLTPHDNTRVLVVGAGMSGIKAANKLHQEGFKVTVLEGRDRVGGRTWSDDSLGVPLDLGASWIHGIEDNPIYQLAQSLNVPLHEWDYENQVTYDANGDEYNKLDIYLEENENSLYYWAAKALFNNSQASVQDAIDIGVESGDLEGFSEKEVAFLANLEIEQDVAADSRDISLAGLWQLEGFDGPDVVFPQGYDALVKALSTDLDIRLNTWVSGVNYLNDEVEVITSQGNFSADYVIITVPLGVLKKEKIEFIPELPIEKKEAIKGLDMGVLNKVYLAFEQIFWDNKVANMANIGSQKGHWSYWINLAPVTGLPILTGFNVADYGKEIEHFKDDDIIELAMVELRRIYGDHIPQPTGHLITRWDNDPFSYGSYSYVPKGVSASLRQVLARPIADKVFFAGEATHMTLPSTVHGAYLSGEREANRIILMNN
jgi:monoamine oxidase